VKRAKRFTLFSWARAARLRACAESAYVLRLAQDDSSESDDNAEADEGLAAADNSGLQDALGAAGLGAGIGNAVVLAVEADDKHRAAVHVAARLVGRDIGDVIAARSRVADALAEAAAAEFVGTAEEVDGVVGIVGGDTGFHSAEMLVTEGKDVRPHA
jgi:hypothetical protein